MSAEPMLELHWSAPAECPDRERVVARVEELVGRMPEGKHTLVATGAVTKAPRYTLSLTIGDAPARVMSGDDCDKLADAAALVIALDIDPDALSRPPPEPPPPPPPPPPPIVPPPPIAPPPRSISAFLGARALVDSGSLPRSTLGLGATLSVAKGWLAAEVDAIGWSSQFTVNGPHDGVSGAIIDLTTFGLRACARGTKLVTSLEIIGCLGGELGVETSRGVRIQRPETSSSLWSALAATARVKVWPTLPVSPTVGITVGRPVSAPSVVIEPFGTVFSPPAAFLRGFLGLEAQFF